VNNPAILAYKIYLDDGSGNQASMVYNTQQKSLTNTAVVPNLITGHVYTIFVTAINELGESTASNEQIVHAGVEPSQIQYLEWETSTTTSVTVRWQLPLENGGLELQYFTVYYEVYDVEPQGTYTTV
jgi:fibronectin type 3 domain-containing protein